MLFLHVSDIHFRAPQCLNPDTDPSRPYRTRLLQSVANKIAELGKADGILIGGDVAFKGDPAEYLAAQEWISQLMEVCGCGSDSVYVVPGNHDVDQRVIKAHVAIQNAQAAIGNCTKNADRYSTLNRQLDDATAGQSLFQPLAAYNEFAKIYNCQIYPKDRVSWKQTRPMGDGVDLRIFGLTSTILSGIGAPNGVRDAEGSMYLSPMQTVFDPVDDTVTLVMCHHPPEWMVDRDDVNDKLNDRTHIHLFGHKHAGRIGQNEGHLRVGAGAVNPDENELGFCPAYNIIDVQVVGAGNERHIKIVTHMMEWQQNPEGYRPRQTTSGGSHFTHSIRFPENPHRLPRPDSTSGLAEARPDSGAAESVAPAAADAEADMGKPDTRNLVARFWRLTSSQRRKVVKELGVFEAREATLPEPEQYGRALIRAGEKNLLDELAVQIQKQEQS